MDSARMDSVARVPSDRKDHHRPPGKGVFSLLSAVSKEGIQAAEAPRQLGIPAGGDPGRWGSRSVEDHSS
jgi:hypothetical protein